jgi:rubrerythrin
VGIVMQEMLRHIDAAIKLEQEGIKKYTEFAKNSKNYYGKLMFERLAMEEEKHAIILEEWKERLSKAEPEQDLTEATNLVSIKASDIFPGKDRSLKGITKDYVTALRFAVDIEDKSNHFYAELAEITADKKMSALFEDLAKFELEHLKLFKSELTFVQSNPMSFN